MMRTFKIYSFSNIYTAHRVQILTIATMLYVTSPWLISFLTGSLSLLILFTHFAHPHLWQIPICSLYLWVWFFVCWFLGSTYKWYHMAFVFFSLISLNILVMPSGPIHVVTNSNLHGLKIIFYYFVPMLRITHPT